MESTKLVGAALLTSAFVGCVAAANWATTHYGFVAVGFGLTATAGTYFAGLALGLRDLVQDVGGKLLVVAAIVAGGVLSWLIADPAIAVASAVAFLFSEMFDLAVYTPLRQRSWTGAVLASNIVGAVADTVIFIALAFGWAVLTAQVLAGQLVGKMWATLAVIGAVAACRFAITSIRRGKQPATSSTEVVSE